MTARRLVSAALVALACAGCSEAQPGRQLQQEANTNPFYRDTGSCGGYLGCREDSLACHCALLF